jgi:hypothetical protein
VSLCVLGFCWPSLSGHSACGVSLCARSLWGGWQQGAAEVQHAVWLSPVANAWSGRLGCVSLWMTGASHMLLCVVWWRASAAAPTTQSGRAPASVCVCVAGGGAGVGPPLHALVLQRWMHWGHTNKHPPGSIPCSSSSLWGPLLQEAEWLRCTA